MKKIYAIFLLAFLSHAIQLKGQFCLFDLPPDSAVYTNYPWYGNNEYLDSIIDEMGYNDPMPEYSTSQSSIEGGFDNLTEVWIPVKAWIYHENNGNGGISEAEVEESIRYLNNRFNASQIPLPLGQASGHTRIQFYIACDIGHVNNTLFKDNPDEGTRLNLIAANNSAHSINIHYINTLSGAWGYASPPAYAVEDQLWAPPASISLYESIERSVIIRTADGGHLNSAIVHEVAHSLGLLHTYHSPAGSNIPNHDASPCAQEYVSRTKTNFPCGIWNGTSGKPRCSTKGDFLCGTAADPLMESSEIAQTSPGIWEYTGTRTDNDNVVWQPNVYNYMTYVDPDNMQFFALHQIAVMREFAGGSQWLKYKHPPHHQNEFIDIYEPDNVIGSAQELKFGIPQLRGLHAVKTGHPSNPSSWQCDVDWVYFEVPFGMKVNISTEPVPGNQQVGSTQIFLIDQDGSTVIGYNNNKSSSSTYSEISNITLSEGTYWLRIENNSSTAGEYYLNLEQCGE
ncbi:MAG: hypothetical protein JJU02_15990 [Cryomorphaceae bacterium]|nr:hypothetical protein [Cryomorphaceae bacterium]